MGTSEIRVALAGLGTVGTAVIRLLQGEEARYLDEIGVPLRLAVVLDRSYRQKDTSWIGPQVTVTDSLEEFLRTPADIVVELLGGTDPADQIITTGLQQRQAVVTANKLLLAKSAKRYFQLAREHNAYLGFEAAVAGGIPILRALRRALFADRIVRLRGILNGTCNFILSEMADSGRPFPDVLHEAQALGYAEADPWLDISGRDTADKLAILSLLAFGKSVDPEHIPTLGISMISPVDLVYARRLECTLRLLGVAERQGDAVFLRVSPFFVSKRLPLSAVSGVLNAVEVVGPRLGSTVFSGRGAGGDPTAVSVVADILNAALWKQGEAPFYLQPFFHRPPPAGKSQIPNSKSQTNSNDLNSKSETCSERLELGARDLEFPPAGAEVYPFYTRFFVKDRPGIIAAVASALARYEININSVWQEPWPDHANLPFVMTVEPTLFATMQQAISELSQLDFNNVPPLALPMLDR
jgi:homoserine dehydrogenase